MNVKSKNLMTLLLLASCWGPSFLFIKVAVAEIPPMVLAGLRIGMGAMILNVLLLIRKDYLPKEPIFWIKSFIAGLMAQVIPFVLINWGEQFVDSSLASLLNGMLPLFTIVLAHFILQDERLTRNKITGVVLGFVGLFVLVFPTLTDGVRASSMGIVAISLATVSYAFGLLYIRKQFRGRNPLHAPSAQLLVDSLYLIPLAFYFEPSFYIQEVSWNAIGSLTVLGVFGTAIAFILYFRLIEQAGAGYASTVTFLMPIYGVILGFIFLNEAITYWTVAGALFILIGIALVIGIRFSIPEDFGKRIDPKLYSRFR